VRSCGLKGGNHFFNPPWSISLKTASPGEVTKGASAREVGTEGKLGGQGQGARARRGCLERTSRQRSTLAWRQPHHTQVRHIRGRQPSRWPGGEPLKKIQRRLDAIGRKFTPPEGNHQTNQWWISLNGLSPAEVTGVAPRGRAPEGKLGARPSAGVVAGTWKDTHRQRQTRWPPTYQQGCATSNDVDDRGWRGEDCRRRSNVRDGAPARSCS